MKISFFMEDVGHFELFKNLFFHLYHKEINIYIYVCVCAWFYIYIYVLELLPFAVKILNIDAIDGRN